jgi:hypothetical protein
MMFAKKDIFVVLLGIQAGLFDFHLITFLFLWCIPLAGIWQLWWLLFGKRRWIKNNPNPKARENKG